MRPNKVWTGLQFDGGVILVHDVMINIICELVGYALPKPELLRDVVPFSRTLTLVPATAAGVDGGGRPPGLPRRQDQSAPRAPARF